MGFINKVNGFDIYASASLSASYATNARNTTPAGTLYDIQFNSGSVLGAHSSFEFIFPSFSLQQGNNVSARGLYSHAQGYNTIASGSYSHAEGKDSIAYADYSHAEGQAFSYGSYSHAEGAGMSVGTYSHAEGGGTTALGYGSHAEGANTTTVGNFSHTEGNNTIASGSFQHVQGQWNTQGDSTSLMIIGNGTSSSRSDAFKVRMSGSIVLPTTQSAAPSWTGTDGEMVFATVTGNHRFYVWMAGAWRSGSLS